MQASQFVQHSHARPPGPVKARMVDFMLERQDQGVTREDLVKHFTPRDVDQYGDAAAREANRRRIRRV